MGGQASSYICERQFQRNLSAVGVNMRKRKAPQQSVVQKHLHSIVILFNLKVHVVILAHRTDPAHSTLDTFHLGQGRSKGRRRIVRTRHL